MEIKVKLTKSDIKILDSGATLILPGHVALDENDYLHFSVVLTPEAEIANEAD